MTAKPDPAPTEAEDQTSSEGKPGGDQAAKTARGKAARTAPPPVTWTEESLNAPSRQTVGMLAILASATLLMWAAGRAACNYHEPGESLSPKAVALEARTRTEKGVALELAQTWAFADFDTARQLATGELLAAIEQDSKTCQGAACEARRAARDATFSVAEVLEKNKSSAFVRVRTVGSPQGEVTKVYEVTRVGSAFKAKRQLPADQPLPPLAEEPPRALRPAEAGNPAESDSSAPADGSVAHAPSDEPQQQ